ncbi:sensor histidine kinase [Mucilaginibacter flavus]|uniref:sensor histidine kinase n=1 Tax=Mucilaginibacter flavus TaxID=931504 RepID=UPI0025B50A32|nr:HAMP domain-containing sensor histidine kinase [Mucilaginibacter flavus]MDN3580721.1 HAMP domain-containing sensor histidine kinase [Mucilaginibacter flavus]
MLNTPKTQAEGFRSTDALFNINNSIRNCLSLIQNETGNRRIICLFDPPIKLIHGDEEKISQVIIHLVKNAIKYSPESKKIEVRTSAENGKVKVSVSDHGIGIPGQLIKGLFEYSKQDNPQETGLKTAAQIIASHHGQIGAESYVDVGSTFWFTLPG